MKIIIDIPEELVEEEHWYTEEELWTVIKAAENGIPLDNVTSRISDLRDSWERDRYEDEAEALNVALRYIDEEVRTHDRHTMLRQRM